MRGKTKRVLEHLQREGSITTMDAFILYKATRLSSIIFNLRSYGYAIKSVNETSISDSGETCHYIRYVYEGEILNER